ncbi:membrane hypothetical protein [Azospirillaceae bacterium]
MRRLVLVALLALIGFMPLTASAQQPTAVKAAAPASDNVYPLVLALGATAGIATVNWMTYGFGTLPLSLGTSGVGATIAPAAAAASRIYVITSGVAGAWIASWLYGK